MTDPYQLDCIQLSEGSLDDRFGSQGRRVPTLSGSG